jgi:hypothetical protein
VLAIKQMLDKKQIFREYTGLRNVAEYGGKRIGGVGEVFSSRRRH